MLLSIIEHTPRWVWALLAALIALGVLQSRPRNLSVRQVTVLPLVLVALSLAGVVSAFHSQPAAFGAALLAWAAGIGGAVALGRRLPAVRGARWQAESRRLHVPGSWLPLGLIVALFLIKYAVGASLAIHPALAADSGLAAGIGLAYGGFSGLFLARAVSLWSLLRHSPAPGDRIQA